MKKTLGSKATVILRTDQGFFDVLVDAAAANVTDFATCHRRRDQLRTCRPAGAPLRQHPSSDGGPRPMNPAPEQRCPPSSRACEPACACSAG